MTEVAPGELAKNQTPPPAHHVTRLLLDAGEQSAAVLKSAQDGFDRVDALISYVSKIETDLADAKTVIRAMAEAEADSDGGAVQAIARTYLKRFEKL